MPELLNSVGRALAYYARVIEAGLVATFRKSPARRLVVDLPLFAIGSLIFLSTRGLADALDQWYAFLAYGAAPIVILAAIHAAWCLVFAPVQIDYDQRAAIASLRHSLKQAAESLGIPQDDPCYHAVMATIDGFLREATMLQEYGVFDHDAEWDDLTRRTSEWERRLNQMIDRPVEPVALTRTVEAMRRSGAQPREAWERIIVSLRSIRGSIRADHIRREFAASITVDCTDELATPHAE